ncbi:MAG: RNA polymerase sigma factor [Chloroflexota bacterium]
MSVANWLFTVARTTLADHWRRYYRGAAPQPLDDELMAAWLYDGSGAESSPDCEQLVGAVLEALPAQYRRLLELRFLRGRSVHEAALEMGVTAGNLKVLQHRALAKAAEIGLPSRVSDRAGTPFPGEKLAAL